MNKTNKRKNCKRCINEQNQIQKEKNQDQKKNTHKQNEDQLDE